MVTDRIADDVRLALGPSGKAQRDFGGDQRRDDAEEHEAREGEPSRAVHALRPSICSAWSRRYTPSRAMSSS